jgi:electron transfer flavoprotein alpha subunit
MEFKDWKGIAVVVEQESGIAENISWELLGKGRDLADKCKEDLIAFIIGKDVKAIAEEAIQRGANLAVVAEHDLLDHYKWETYSRVVTEMIQKYKPSNLIFGATPNGRDLAGRVAVRIKSGLTADVVDLDIQEDGLLLGSVPGFGGSIVAVIKCETSRPQMATVRPGIFTAKEINTSNKGKIKDFKIKLEEKDISTHLIQKIKVETEDISKAKRLVTAGRGVGNDLSQIKELAELLDASVGVTRPLCDDGILPRNYQVGSTGVTVKPKISLAFGISGAMHFTSGIKDSDTIIAVNIDDKAVIFDYADYGVVGDVNDIMPKLLEKLKAKLLQRVN